MCIAFQSFENANPIMYKYNLVYDLKYVFRYIALCYNYRGVISRPHMKIRYGYFGNEMDIFIFYILYLI